MQFDLAAGCTALLPMPRPPPAAAPTAAPVPPPARAPMIAPAAAPPPVLENRVGTSSLALT